MKKRRRSLDAVRTMPSLRHSIPGEAFDIRKSEVASWLCSQPEVMQYVFDQANYTGSIVYDVETGTWAGADHEA